MSANLLNKYYVIEYYSNKSEFILLPSQINPFLLDSYIHIVLYLVYNFHLLTDAFCEWVANRYI